MMILQHVNVPRRLVTALIIGLLAVAFASATDVANQARFSRGGGIDVAARFVNLEAVRSGGTEELRFAINMDTHTVNLFGIDMDAVAEFYADDRRLETVSIRWEAGPESSHHRSGTLVAIVSPERTQSHTPRAGGVVELRLLEVGQSARSFRWTL